jgi:hypothetical protein
MTLDGMLVVHCKRRFAVFATVGFAGKRSGVIWSKNAKAPVKRRIGAAWQDHEPGR